MSKDVEDKAKKIQIDRIGDSCFFDAVSCLLEYVDKLYWALDYVEYKFLYESSRFLDFNEKETLVLSPTDNYYFLNGTGSGIYRDVTKYTFGRYKKTLGKMFEYREEKIENFFTVIRALSKMDVPFGLEVNNLEFKDFYKRNGFTIPRSPSHHIVNILEVSDNGKQCYLFDRGFDCFGCWIDTEELYMGVLTDFFNYDQTYTYMFFQKELPPTLNKNQIKAKLLENLNRALQKNIKVGDRIYLNNSIALKTFLKNYEEIVAMLEKRYGEMTAAMIGEAILLQVDGAMGVTGLFRYINTLVESSSLESILQETRRYWEVWSKLEARLKYATYKGVCVHKYTPTIKSHIEELIDLDAIIMAGIRSAIKEIT